MFTARVKKEEEKMRCDCCGKFRKKSDIVCMQAEVDEYWYECRFCMSPVDEERYFKKELSSDHN